MDMLEIAAVVAGALLMLAVLLDVLLTILHPDVEGILARRVQRTTWFLARRLQRREGPGGRALAAAGPVMIAATFVVWIIVFVGSYSLIVWAALDHGFIADPDLGPLTYLDALYFAGGTVTVLGYGDMTPVSAPMQLLALVAAASGFVLLTGIVTYVIQLTTSLTDRIQLSLRLHDDTHGTWDGTDLVLSDLDSDVAGAGRSRDRLDELATLVRTVHDRLHRLPTVGLLYRSSDATRAPEPALATVLEVALAAGVVATDDRFAALRPAERSLRIACDRIMLDVATQYLPTHTAEALETRPSDDDGSAAQAVAEVQQRVMDRLGSGPTDAEEELVAFAARSQRFLTDLDAFTGWRRHPTPSAGRMP